MRKTENEMRKVMDEIKACYQALNEEVLVPAEYEFLISNLCDEHGTEYVATAFVKLTKNGEL